VKSKIAVLLLFIAFFSCGKKVETEVANDSSKVFAFDDNQIRFYEKIYYKSFGNCPGENDCAEIKIEYPEIIVENEPQDLINKYLSKQLLNVSLYESEYKNIDEVADSLFSYYISMQKEFPDYHISWFLHSNIKITGIFKNIISIKKEETSFTGGASIFYNLGFANFDITKGTVLTLEDVVSEENLSKLQNLGKKAFYKLKNIDENTNLQNAGFWFENKQFELNDNFAITDSGLVFFYNLYEIAPRVEGTTELFLPKKEIVGLTKIYN